MRNASKNKTETNVEIVLMLHSLWRWAVVVVALAALVKFGLGWIQKKTPDDLDRRLRLIFVTVIDVQVLLGLILVVLFAINGTLARPAIEHSVIMVIVLILAHLTARWSKRQDTTFLRNNFLDVLAVVVLIGVGVARVGGWSF